MIDWTLILGRIEYSSLLCCSVIMSTVGAALSDFVFVHHSQPTRRSNVTLSGKCVFLLLSQIVFTFFKVYIDKQKMYLFSVQSYPQSGEADGTFYIV